MSELVSQLGIDWKLLLAQGVNFLILLVVLTKFVYKPLMKMVEERRKRIEFGKKADTQAVAIISEAEKNAQKKAQEIATQADKKAQQTLKEIMLIAERKEKEQMNKVEEEAKKLVKEAIIRTVQLKPEQVDEKLIEEAVRGLRV